MYYHRYHTKNAFFLTLPLLLVFDQLRQPSTNTGVSLQRLVATDSFQHLCVDFDSIHLIFFFLPKPSCSMPGSDDVEPHFPAHGSWQPHTFPLWYPVDSSETHCHCHRSSLSSELLDFKLLSIHFLVHGSFLCIIYFTQGPELLVFSSDYFLLPLRLFQQVFQLHLPSNSEQSPPAPVHCSVWSCALRSYMYCLGSFNTYFLLEKNSQLFGSIHFHLAALCWTLEFKQLD